MEFDCVTTDSGGCDCYVVLRKLIASVSLAVEHMWNIENVNFNLIVVTEIGIKLTDFFNSILSGGAEEWRN
jgi:hypothetical protein